MVYVTSIKQAEKMFAECDSSRTASTDEKYAKSNCLPSLS